METPEVNVPQPIGLALLKIGPGPLFALLAHLLEDCMLQRYEKQNKHQDDDDDDADAKKRILKNIAHARTSTTAWELQRLAARDEVQCKVYS